MHWEKRLFFMAKRIKANSAWKNLSMSENTQSATQSGHYGPHYTPQVRDKKKGISGLRVKTKMQLTQRKTKLKEEDSYL